MPITALDALVILIILLSAFLAMVRGASREILSFASWILAGYVAYQAIMFDATSIAEKFISHKQMALVITVLVVFFVALLIISIITMKIADLIIDSRIGALDRALGFVFGIIRGVLIVAIAVLFANRLVDVDKRPSWYTEAKTKPIFDNLSEQLYNFLPKDLEKLFDKFLADLNIGGSSQSNDEQSSNGTENTQPVE